MQNPADWPEDARALQRRAALDIVLAGDENFKPQQAHFARAGPPLGAWAFDKFDPDNLSRF